MSAATAAKPIVIAVAQFAPVADARANLASIRELTAAAVERGAALVVFPEYSSFFLPELGPLLLAAAQPLDGPFVSALGALAREFSVHIVAGLVATSAESERFSNTLVAISPTEGLVASYQKLHLYDAFGQRESQWVRPGELTPPQTFAFAGFTVGLQTCYDVRFPEVSRRLVDAGAELLVVPAEWVRGPLKESHWRTLLTARAIENTVYVAAADHAPPIGVGNSMILDPMGVELATIGETSGVVTAVISLERVAEVRATNPSLAARRFGIAPH